MFLLFLILLLAAPACADVDGVHAVSLEGKSVFYTRQGQAPVRVPVVTQLGPWGGTVRIASAGSRVLVLAPAAGGFCLAVTDDGGRTWKTRTSRSITGHEEVESQRIAARGRRVYLTWIDEHAAKTPGDAVGKPLYLAISEDGGGSWSAPRSVTEGRPPACPCCVPALAVTPRAVYIAYRTTVRNVKEVALLASRDGGRTFAYRPVSDDRWHFLGCPAKGPELEARGHRVSVTWVREKTRLTARSRDGGRTFSRPARAD